MWLLDQWAERHILDAQTKVSLIIFRRGEPLTWMMIRMCLNYAQATVYSKCRLSSS
jgi:hypothetical protein